MISLSHSVSDSYIVSDQGAAYGVYADHHFAKSLPGTSKHMYMCMCVCMCLCEHIGWLVGWLDGWLVG